MSTRSYKQKCALARASDVIGERWTLLLIRDLLIGARRFNELLASLKGIGANLLASRLKSLEAASVIERVKIAAPDRRTAPSGYALTEQGRALEPAVLALVRWGLTHGPSSRPGDHHRDDWDLLALKALFQPKRHPQLSLRVQFTATDFVGWAQIKDRQMTVGLGSASPDGVVQIGIHGTVADLFLGGNPNGLLETPDGTERLQQFLSAFALRV